MPIFRGKQIVSPSSDYKDSVRALLRNNINLNTLIYAADGVNLDHTDRVLLVGQTDSAQNGLYSYNSQSHKLTRSSDADNGNEISAGLKVYVEEGTENAKTTWVLITPGVINLGVTGLTFVRENRIGQLETAGVYGSASKSVRITIDEFGAISLIEEIDISLDAGEY